jgi:hypothetical protein
MFFKKKKINEKSETSNPSKNLKDILDAVEALRKEEQGPVPCYVMKGILRKKLFLLAEKIRPSVYGEETGRKVFSDE